MEKALGRLAEVLGEHAQRDAPLAPYTSMRVGGPADLLVLCCTVEDVVEAVRLARAHDVPWRVLGGGCNVLVSDAGVRGLVIVNRAGDVQVEESGVVSAEAGAMMAVLSRETVEQSLTGLEWAAGLPGTVGGAVVGNAGAFGGDMASILTQVTILERDGSVVEQPGEWMAFVYRSSRIKRQPKSERPVVLAVKLQLQPGDRETLRAQMTEILQWRRARHPSGATMGSTFKNAPDAHAGRLIEGVGLKGYQIGGVKVSELHANFFMNTGNGKAADVLALIRYVQAEVAGRLGVQLEPEIELVGEWEDSLPVASEL